MSHTVKLKPERDENLTGWDAMIRDARKRIASLQSSIRVFEKKKLAGASWPGVFVQDSEFMCKEGDSVQSRLPMTPQRADTQEETTPFIKACSMQRRIQLEQSRKWFGEQLVGLICGQQPAWPGETEEFHRAAIVECTRQLNDLAKERT